MIRPWMFVAIVAFLVGNAACGAAQGKASSEVAKSTPCERGVFLILESGKLAGHGLG